MGGPKVAPASATDAPPAGKGEEGAKKDAPAKKKKKKGGCWCCACCRSTPPDNPNLFVETNERKCRDTQCLVVLLAFWFIWFIVSKLAVDYGNPNRLLYGNDYKQNICGAGKNEDQFKLYYPRLNEDLLEYASSLDFDSLASVDLTSLDYQQLLDIKLTGVCVKSCPNFGAIVCTDDYMEQNNCDQDCVDQLSVDQCRTSLAYNSMHQDLCSQCWFVALNTTEVMFRCLEVVYEVSSSAESCTFPKYDPTDTRDPPQTLLAASDDRCVKKDVVKTIISEESGYPNPIAKAIGGLVSVGSSVSSDVLKTMPIILVCGVFGSLYFGFTWLLTLKFSAKIIIWGTILGFIGLLTTLDLYLWYQSGTLDPLLLFVSSETGTNITTSGAAPTVTSNVTWTAPTTASDFAALADGPPPMSKDTYKNLGIACSIFLGLIIVVIIAVRKKIQIMIAIVIESTNAMMKLPMLVFMPWLFGAQVAVVTTFTLVIGSYIRTLNLSAAAEDALSMAGSSCGAGLNTTNATRALTYYTTLVEAGNATLDCSRLSNVTTADSATIKDVVFAYHIFCFLWTQNFILACQCCVISGAICKWYWTRPPDSDRKDLGDWPIFGAVWRTYRFHAGSMAIGSFLLAVTQSLRLALDYLDRQTKGLQANNKWAKYLMRVLQCVLYCFERCMKYLTQDAYIIIAMRGFSFWSAAKQVIRIILGNLAQLSVASLMTKWVTFMGKLFITLAVTVMAAVWLQYDKGYEEAKGPISSPVVPIICVYILGYFMATSFLNVFALTMHTILICFIEDRQANKDRPEQAFYPEELAKVLLNASERRAQRVFAEKELKQQGNKNDAKKVKDGNKEEKNTDKKADQQEAEKRNKTVVEPIQQTI